MRGTVRNDDFLLQNEEAIKTLLAEMTLSEKIGQMTQAELSSLEDFSEIAELNLGSVLSGGDSDPGDGNSINAWSNAYKDCQKQAISTRLKIPLLYGIDAVHGHNNVEDVVIFPHNIGLGCTRNPELIRDISRVTALEIRATGINWTFAPCVTVPRDDRWGRTYEGFSEDPDLVSLLGLAAIQGLQGEDLSDQLRVLGCAKHFVGDGGTSPQLRVEPGGHIDSGSTYFWDQGDTKCSEEVLRDVHLKPYIPLINYGVGSIMPSYSSWNGKKCTGNQYLLSKILKEELGFKGFLISDYSAIDQVDEDYKEAIKLSINAGIDMAMVPGKHRKFITLLNKLVEEGSVPESRIDDAVKRILRVKFAMGLLEPTYSADVDTNLASKVNSAEHRMIARDAVRQSLVLLKNESSCLPIKNESRILVCGKAANNLGIQCGGWTIDWQGKLDLSHDTGSTILDSFKKRANNSENLTVDYQESLAPSNEPYDLTVFVVGEKPYAEGKGDSDNLELPKFNSNILSQIKNTPGKKLLIILSGRPIPLTKDMLQADAIVAAWLPGTEGEGITDVLFGDHDFAGKLSFSWPYDSNDHPLNGMVPGVKARYSLGYGLKYSNAKESYSASATAKSNNNR